MDWKELQQLCNDVRDCPSVEAKMKAIARLQELGPMLIPTLVEMLDGARKFRGDGKTHKVCEMINDQCWICGSDE